MIKSMLNYNQSSHEDVVWQLKLDIFEILKELAVRNKAKGWEKLEI